MLKRSNDSVGAPRFGMRLLRWLAVFLVFPVIFALAAPASSARTAKKRTYSMTVSGLADRLCANQTYTVYVDLTVTTTLVSTDASKPPEEVSETRLRGFKVKASVVDESIAAFTLTAPLSGGGFSGGTADEEDWLPPLPHNYSFYLKTLKPGKTSILVIADVPKRINKKGNVPRFIKKVDFEVIRCDYLMDMDYDFKFDFKEGTHTEGKGGMKDLKLKLNPETLRITGRGDLGSTVSGGWKNPGEECEDDPLDVTNRVNVGGSLEGGQLLLKLYFLPSSFVVTRRCVRIELGGGRNRLPPQPSHATLFGPIPMLDMKVPAEGGTDTGPPPYSPNPDLTGEINISVEPDTTKK